MKVEKTETPQASTGLVIRETKFVRQALTLAEVVAGSATCPIGEVVGAPGTGKSCAARAIVARLPRAVRMVAWDGMSKFQAGREVAQALGFDGAGAVDRMLATRLDPDPATRTLLVMDEANKLSWRVLELLRYLSDECNVGVLLVGTELYSRQFASARTRDLLLQLGSRIGAKRCQFGHLDRADAYTHVIKPRFGEVADKDLVTRYWTVTRRGNLRECVELADECQRIMAANGVSTLTPAVLDVAAKWMANRIVSGMEV